MMNSTFPNSVIGDEWEEFDVLQTNITPNHIAKVFRGRAGIARLNLDGSEEIKYDSPEVDDLNKQEHSKMTVKIKIDSAEVEVSKDVANHIEALSAKADSEKAKVDTVTAERDALQAKVDGIPDLIKTAVEEAKAKSDQESEVISIAKDAGIKTDGLSIKEIKIAYIKGALNVDASDKSDSYIDTSFDIAKQSDKMAAVRATVAGGGREDSDDESTTKNDSIPDPQARFRK